MMAICEASDLHFGSPSEEQLPDSPLAYVSKANSKVGDRSHDAGDQGDPLILDSDPVPYTQGRIVSYDKEALTVEAELLEGYKPPTDNGGIKLFTPEGVMLPHTQDVTQGYEDMGEPLCIDVFCMSLLINDQITQMLHPDFLPLAQGTCTISNELRSLCPCASSRQLFLENKISTCSAKAVALVPDAVDCKSNASQGSSMPHSRKHFRKIQKSPGESFNCNLDG